MWKPSSSDGGLLKRAGRFCVFGALLSVACGSSGSTPAPQGGAGSPTCGSSSCVGLNVTASSARSCDVVLEGKTPTELSVRFASAVRGVSEERGTKLAVAFTSKNDAPIAPGAVVIQAKAGAADLQGQQLKVTSATCYDRSGRPLEGAGIQILTGTK